MPFITDTLQLDPHTTTELNNMVGVLAGTIAYDNTLNVLVFYNGTEWKPFTLS